ncbi:MAG: hypothetical protein ACT4PV_05085 [Planctomycetaceae bacterium]
MVLRSKKFLSGLVTCAAATLVVSVACPSLLPDRTESSPVRAASPAVPEPAAPALPPLVDRTAPRTAPTRPAAPDETREDAAAAERAAELGAKRDAARAVATLRNIISAQAQFQATARADEDADGVGEFGSFGELSGACPVRDGKPLNPPVLSAAFREVKGGRVTRGGYHYRIYLPLAGHQGVAERDGGGYAAHQLDPDLAEGAWCCYAWPVEEGLPTLFVNQAGDVLENRGAEYAGEFEPPAVAAFEPASLGVTGRTAVGSRGSDGFEWRQVG